MSERLVTEADLREDECECGHRLSLHPLVLAENDSLNWHADWVQYSKGEHCACARSVAEVKLDRLDAIVRREVAKALREVAAHVFWSDGVTRIKSDIRKHADEIESGGQS
jgi:hypothetical protein